MVAKYDMIISFDDLARQFSEHFPKTFIDQRGIFLFFPRSDWFFPKGISQHSTDMRYNLAP